MSTGTVAAEPGNAGRSRDALFVVGLALVATSAICGLASSPGAQTTTVGVVLALLVLRWHERRDLVGLAVGATFGNATELSSALGGVWLHARPQLFGVLPPYILLCYPILGLAVPRLIDALVGAARPAEEAVPSNKAFAAAMWAIHVALSFRFGTNNTAELVVSVGCLMATMVRFRTRHDLATAAFGAVLGLVWEIPCTLFGAWRFPAPQVLGLLPAWLPFAYAVFFVNLGRLSSLSSEEVARDGC